MSETQPALRAPASMAGRMPGRVGRVGGAARGAAQQASLREHNLSLVLRAIVEAPTPTTRARIATGI